MPELQSIASSLGVFNVLWSLALTAAIYLRKPGVDAAAAVELLRAEMARTLRKEDQRLTEIETHLNHMPSREELREVEGTLKQVSERTLGMSARVDSLATTLSRSETFLLNHGRAQL